MQNADDSPLALDRLAEESAAVLTGSNEDAFEELLRLNGSSSGARPKIVAQVSTDEKEIIHGRQVLQRGFAHWMIKFPSSQDARDVGAIEYAYSLVAKDAGVEMSETHLFCTKRNKYFGTNASTGTTMPVSICAALAARYMPIIAVPASITKRFCA
jgi:serine/threonine-protein kinase HipA